MALVKDLVIFSSPFDLDAGQNKVAFIVNVHIYFQEQQQIKPLDWVKAPGGESGSMSTDIFTSQQVYVKV